MTVSRIREEETLLVYLRVQLLHSYGGTRENHEYLSHGHQDSNRLALIYEAASKALGRMVRYRCNIIH